MRFAGGKIPGHGHVAIDVQIGPVFDHPQVVDVDPVRGAMRLQLFNNFGH